jgi:NADPH:quinone reductase-like Zn-dependent oxidoreductase
MVATLGQNPFTYMRAGTYAVKPAPPYTPGSDGAGIVEAVGEEVKTVKQGDSRIHRANHQRCICGIRSGTRRTGTSTAGKYCFRQGAGIWVPYGTAYHALYHSAKAHASETLLAHGRAAESVSRRSKSRAPLVYSFWVRLADCASPSTALNGEKAPAQFGAEYF